MGLSRMSTQIVAEGKNCLRTVCHFLRSKKQKNTKKVQNCKKYKK